VCNEQFSLKAQVKCLPCGHFFHPTCLDTWLATNGSCPVDGAMYVTTLHLHCCSESWKRVRSNVRGFVWFSSRSVVAQAVAAQPAYVGAQQPQPSVYVQAAPANSYHPQAVNVVATREEICRGCGMRFTPPPDARPNTAMYYRCRQCNSAGATCWALCTIS
jgi:hypothetical protein